MENHQPETEKQPVTTHTTINTTESRSGGAPIFILGGVVVAVLAIGYFLFSSGNLGGAGAQSGGEGVSISVETGGGDSSEATTTVPDASSAPEAAPEAAAEPAPAE